jgi:DNA-binding transcriptional MerR regulator
MKEACNEVSMTYEALKFYCNEGLVPNVKRDENNCRVFDERDINWIKGLTCLKNCGMSIQEMKIYLELCLAGEASIPARKIILAQKRDELLHRITVLNDAVSYIDWKQQFYDDVLSGKTEYVSNLIQSER